MTLPHSAPVRPASLGSRTPEKPSHPHGIRARRECRPGGPARRPWCGSTEERGPPLTTTRRRSTNETAAAPAYRTEQGRRWFRHNPSGEPAVAAATKASTAARDRVAQHLLTVRLEQLREQATGRRVARAGVASWAAWLPEPAAPTVVGTTTGAV
ncbi:hypothetical protein [Streptomyces sp. NPDC001770]